MAKRCDLTGREPSYGHDVSFSTAASRTLEPNQVLILLAARPTGAQWLCPPL
jgi:ribosomal protein L28